MNKPHRKKEYERIAELFKIMANAKRLEILNLLKEKEMIVTELVNGLGIRKANVSQHLALLRYTGLVTARRQGKNVFYKIANPKVVDIFEIVGKLRKQK